MSVLGVYDPAACDERGVPLDWERCQCCEGGGIVPGVTGAGSHVERRCEPCDGYGSLKAAALEEAADCSLVDGVWWRRNGERDQPRCEGCGHPMSDGTWINPLTRKGTDSAGVEMDMLLLDGESIRTLLTEPFGNFARWAERRGAVHWSPCDEGCRHGGPVRAWWKAGGPRASGFGAQPENEAGHGEAWDAPAPASALVAEWGSSGGVEASWRAVDVRTLGWPHDLRPEKLAVLCLRCWAAR